MEKRKSMLRDFKIHNRRGQILVGDVTVPDSCRGLFFVQHGLSGSRQQPYAVAIRSALVAQGYAVCIFDCAHSWGESDGDLHDATLTKHHDDLCDVMDWASGQLWYREPFGLIGHSLGAASVILYVAQHAHKILATVLLSTVTGYADWAEAYQRYNPAEWHRWHDQKFIEKSDPLRGKYGQIGMSFLDDLRQYELLASAEAIRANILMIAGDQDHRTLLEHQKVFFDRLPKPVSSISRFHIIQGAAHTFISSSEMKYLTQYLQDWLTGWGK